MSFWDILFELIALLGSAIVLGALFECLRLSALSGYLLAGLLLGPGGFNVIANNDLVSGLAEMGVALLLFSIGLEFSWKKLKRSGAVAVIGGLLQVALNILFFMMIFMAAGIEVPLAFALGIMATPSSTAVMTRVLKDDRSLESIHARASIGLSLVQDLSLVPMVMVIASLDIGGEPLAAVGGFTWSLLMSLVILVLFYVVTTWVFPKLLRGTARTANRDLFVMVAVVTCMLGAWGSQSIGVSPALGVFVAGMLLAESPYADLIRADISSLRALFVTLFFVSIGMLADPGWILAHWQAMLLALVLVTLLKTIIVHVILRRFNLPVRNAFAGGLLLSNVGEFSFILAAAGSRTGLLSGDFYNAIIAITSLSLFVSPFIVKKSAWLGEMVESLLRAVGIGRENGQAAVSTGKKLQDHILVIGLGPAGVRVVETLREQGLTVIAVELNPKLTGAARDMGARILIGDAGHPEILEAASAGSAAVIVVTVPDPAVTTKIVGILRARCPTVPLVARSRWDRYHAEIAGAGADEAINEEELVGDSLGQAVLRRLGTGS